MQFAGSGHCITADRFHFTLTAVILVRKLAGLFLTRGDKLYCFSQSFSVPETFL